ncbi:MULTISPECIES: hypothetical protein [Aminobacterium]|uniref:hypothetical protein n=1 Tax=Aminobacterium TaxID=81466 RepID=UPI000463AA39|nr:MULTISPECIES: hypothetical protein [Aminobacterium]
MNIIMGCQSRCTRELLFAFVFVSFALCIWAPVVSYATVFSHSGQVSLWGAYNDDTDSSLGIRYIPEITISFGAGAETGAETDTAADSETDLNRGTQTTQTAQTLDALVSFNIRTLSTFGSFKELEDKFHADLYRSWVRLSGERYEVRLGLQRINFGPAQILRSLKWFDQIDPRDPLSLTDGVNALLGRYYFPNNSNIWVWGLYGNGDPEFGLRYQFPVANGEMAFTYHNRRVDREWWNSNTFAFPRRVTLEDGLEQRYALDGSFDVGIGLWFEFVMSRLKKDSKHTLSTTCLTLGADYTFDVGSGVHVLAEHFIRSPGSDIWNHENDDEISALSIDFSTGILDTVTILTYYDWQKKEFYPNVSWQRTYDDWLINVTAFHNGDDANSVYSGTGVVLTFVYNY